jgi:hypothetical protein
VRRWRAVSRPPGGLLGHPGGPASRVGLGLAPEELGKRIGHGAPEYSKNADS